jgi:hypothetical protein
VGPGDNGNHLCHAASLLHDARQASQRHPQVRPCYEDLSGRAGEPPHNLAMGASIEREKSLWRGYRLVEQRQGSCFLSIEPLLPGSAYKELLWADQAGKVRQIIVGGESGKGLPTDTPGLGQTIGE